MKRFCFFVLLFTFIGCQSSKGFAYTGNPLFGWLGSSSFERKTDTTSIFKRYPQVIANEFEFPAGGKFAEGFYIAQKFGVENAKFGNRLHLGEDWNFIGGGDSDFASPVYSIADGVVSLIANYGGGWGKVIRVVYKLPNNGSLGDTYIEALYAHLYTIEVEPSQIVRRGEWLGSIGDAGGKYPSHLHFELREKKDAPLGGGYAVSAEGYLHPTKFLIQQLAKEKKLTEEQFAYERIVPAQP
ncbi:MAG: M23 family metallopeptidase [Leptospira sp.]|nr:M23 family metallopeptidase [Leptospira sp.]